MYSKGRFDIRATSGLAGLPERHESTGDTTPDNVKVVSVLHTVAVGLRNIQQAAVN